MTKDIYYIKKQKNIANQNKMETHDCINIKKPHAPHIREVHEIASFCHFKNNGNDLQRGVKISLLLTYIHIYIYYCYFI